MRTKSRKTGDNGEYRFADFARQNGFITAHTMRNAKDVDVQLYHEDTFQPALVQVKTRSAGKKTWLLQARHEHIEHDFLFYAFVTEGESDVFIIPSRVVAETVRNGFRLWMSTPGKNGQAHNDNPQRSFGRWDQNGHADASWLEQYRNAWHLLSGVK